MDPGPNNVLPVADLGGATLRAHLHSGRSPDRMTRATLAAMVPVAATGIVLFGHAAAGVMLWGVAGALLGEAVMRWVSPRGRRGHFERAALMGLLLAFTLPPQVGWYVPLAGGSMAIVVGQGILGGAGNLVWHPALVGWAALHLCFNDAMAPDRWPFLASGYLVRGDLAAASIDPTFRGFRLSRPPPGVEAWARPRPIDALIELHQPSKSPHPGAAGNAADVQGPSQHLTRIFRDSMPPWEDTLWGTVGGGVGETCTLALVLSGLCLMHLGQARWQSSLAAIVGVATVAALAPIRIHSGGALHWFPALQAHEGFPAGFALLLFHLTGDGLLLTAFVLATDPPTTPLTGRGRAVFGFGLGVLTMLARWAGLTPGSGYWALLAMNTLVPWIDRLTRRCPPGVRGV